MIYSVEFEVLLWIDADGADDSIHEVVEFIETNLFTYNFISLIELSEEFLCCMSLSKNILRRISLISCSPQSHKSSAIMINSSEPESVSVIRR